MAESQPEPTSNPARGMPRRREKQRALPVGEKVALLGQVILETRRLEEMKKACKPADAPELKSCPETGATIFAPLRDAPPLDSGSVRGMLADFP